VAAIPVPRIDAPDDADHASSHALAAPALLPANVPLPQPKPGLTIADYLPASLPVVVPTPREAREAAPTSTAGNTAPGYWTVQIGAFGDATRAKLAAYADRSRDILGQSSQIVAPFQSADGHTLYRARFGPFAERDARELCEAMTRRGQTCFAAIASR
jgi:D-alanyl-D-alanine carboxypeptidase